MVLPAAVGRAVGAPRAGSSGAGPCASSLRARRRQRESPPCGSGGPDRSAHAEPAPRVPPTRGLRPRRCPARRSSPVVAWGLEQGRPQPGDRKRREPNAPHPVDRLTFMSGFLSYRALTKEQGSWLVGRVLSVFDEGLEGIQMATRGG